MIIDNRSKFAEAVLVEGGSAIVGDFMNVGGDFDIGPGTPLFWVLQLDTPANDESSETYSFALQTDDNNSFSSATTIATITVLKGAAAGSRYVLGFPFQNEKFLRVYSTLADGGGDAEVNVTTWLTMDPPTAYQAYPQNLNA